MDRTIGKSQKRNNDGERLMLSFTEIAKSIYEADASDDKMIQYKDKDGESAEMKASSAKTMDKDHPAKIAWDDMQADHSDEKEKGKDLGAGDFGRDSDEPEDGGDEPKGKIDFDDDDKVEKTVDDMLAKTAEEHGFNSAAAKHLEGEIIGPWDFKTWEDYGEHISDKAAKLAAHLNRGSTKRETISINGKKYRPIKESKKPNKRVLKENYNRIFGEK